MSIDPRNMASADTSPSATLCALVDTNVALDLLLEREPWLSQARPLWDARDSGNLFVFLPASVLTDIFYICRKQVGFNRAKQAVQACMQGFAIIAVDRSIVAAALTLPGDDFEDNVQIACAQSAGLDFIITRNSADFEHSPIPVVEPSAVISHLRGLSS